jgi:hypothetical protein
MTNVVDIAERRSLLRPKLAVAHRDVDVVLARLDEYFTSPSETARKNLILINATKGILRSRSVKFRAHVQGVSDVLGKKTTVLFISRKIAFSLDVKSNLILDNGWVVYPLQIDKNPADNVGLILAKLEEV